MEVVSTLAERLARSGLNLVGATSVAAYDERVPARHRIAPHLPAARGLIVVGNGGGAFWGAFRDACRARPERAEPPDPLDRFTREVVTAAVNEPDARCLFPFDTAPVPVAFQTLAEVAGLGRPGLVGVLIHPVYGPWIALRAAVALPDVLTAARPADGFDPCPTCTLRPCIAACPAAAVGPRGWDVPRCAAHRLAPADTCAGGCHARMECVYGQAHRYPSAALAFHQASARSAMAAYASARSST
ncbi:MAG TPA: hypothetical protein VMS22_00500 [Candidatus Eisenbacteria bacterium]|nr:hypothetical protein [Candidatus Eisenbacteria bacterium]